MSDDRYTTVVMLLTSFAWGAAFGVAIRGMRALAAICQRACTRARK